MPIPSNNAFSWAFWIKPDRIQAETALLETILEVGNNYMSPGIFIMPDGSLEFYSFTFTGGGIESLRTPPETVATNTWVHVACTSSLTGARQIFVNGVNVAQGISHDYGWQGSRLLIGRDRLDLLDRFSGIMDDLRVWTRTITPDEIAALFFAGDCNGDSLLDIDQILFGDLPDANNNGIPDWIVSIARQPVDQSVGVDQPVFFVVETVATPSCTTPVAYRWQRRNPLVADETAADAWLDLQDGGGFLNTGTPSLTILRPTPALATGYRCRISGGCGCEGTVGGTAFTNTVNFGVACPADFNADGGIDFGDIEAFFERWENGC
jgi:hypothetical protein